MVSFLELVNQQCKVINKSELDSVTKNSGKELLYDCCIKPYLEWLEHKTESQNPKYTLVVLIENSYFLLRETQNIDKQKHQILQSQVQQFIQDYTTDLYLDQFESKFIRLIRPIHSQLKENSTKFKAYSA